MYEMYPDDWAATPRPQAQAQRNGQPVRPRRRQRRPHSVTPSILMQENVIRPTGNQQ